MAQKALRTLQSGHSKLCQKSLFFGQRCTKFQILTFLKIVKISIFWHLKKGHAFVDCRHFYTRLRALREISWLVETDLKKSIRKCIFEGGQNHDFSDFGHLYRIFGQNFDFSEEPENVLKSYS